MRLFSLGRMFDDEHRKRQQAQAAEKRAYGLNLVGSGGYLLLLKYLLFALFGYYNARLFITTVPGIEGWGTALCALAGEATALYCLNNCTKSAGGHQKALFVFGGWFTIFSAFHATASFFGIDKHDQFGAGIDFYAKRVAFPLLFGTLTAAAIIIPLLHWEKKIAAARAKSMVEIAASAGELEAEKAKLRNETELENARLEFIDQRIRTEQDYLRKLEQVVKVKNQQAAILDEIDDPAFREQVALTLGLTPDNTPKWLNPPSSGNSGSSGKP